MGHLILNVDFGHIRSIHFIGKMIQDITGMMYGFYIENGSSFHVILHVFSYEKHFLS